MKYFKLIHSSVNKEKTKVKEDYINALVLSIEKEMMMHCSRDFAIMVYDEVSFSNPVILFSFTGCYGDNDWHKRVTEEWGKNSLSEWDPAILEVNFSKTSFKTNGDSFMRDEHRLKLSLYARRDNSPNNTFGEYLNKTLDDLQKAIFRTVEELGYVPGAYEKTLK